jgi:hypothetical protein
VEHYRKNAQQMASLLRNEDHGVETVAQMILKRAQQSTFIAVHDNTK